MPERRIPEICAKHKPEEAAARTTCHEICPFCQQPIKIVLLDDHVALRHKKAGQEVDP